MDVGEQTVHAKPVTVPGEREQSRAQDVQAVVDPSPGLYNAPPAAVLSGVGDVMASHLLETLIRRGV